METFRQMLDRLLTRFALHTIEKQLQAILNLANDLYEETRAPCFLICKETYIRKNKSTWRSINDNQFHDYQFYYNIFSLRVWNEIDHINLENIQSLKLLESFSKVHQMPGLRKLLPKFCQTSFHLSRMGRIDHQLFKGLQWNQIKRQSETR